MRSLRQLPLPRRSRDERGAVAVFVTIVTLVLVMVSALAVDIGVQRVARTDMQSLSDVVALDVARQLQGQSATTLLNDPGFQQAVVASVKRNGSTLGAPPKVTVEVGQMAASAFVSAGSVTYQAPQTSTQGTQVTLAAAVPNAVRITSGTTVDFAFAKIAGISSGSASRSSIAAGVSSACFDMGSFAVALSSGDSSLLAPLNALLGLNLGLVSYQGLATSQVTLAGLAADARIGSVDALLGGQVSLGNFVAATISVLNNDHVNNNSAAIAALGLIQASALDLSKKVDVGKLVSLVSGDGAALSSSVNVLDLISGAVQVANGSHAVSLSSLNIAGITGDVYVTQGIQRACGLPNSPTAHASASQISANLTVPLAFPAGTSVLGLTVTGSASVTGGIGNAEGQLVAPPAVSCKSGTTADPDTYRVNVNGGLLGVGVRANLTINGVVSTGLLNGLLDSLLGSLVKVEFRNVTVGLGATAPGVSASAQPVDLKVPQNAINVTPRGTPVKTGSAFGGTGTIPTLTPSTVTGGSIIITTGGIPLLGIPGQTTVVDLSRGSLAALVSTLLVTVNGVVNSVVNTTLVPNLNALLTPLAKLLGVNVGGADVYSEFRPTCNGAQLVG